LIVGTLKLKGNHASVRSLADFVRTQGGEPEGGKN